MKKILIRMALAALLVGIGIAGKPCNADSCIAKPSIGRDIIMCCKGFYIDPTLHVPVPYGCVYSN